MKLTSKLAVAALAATALIAPSSALAGGKAHLLGSYKVEEHIDLEGEAGTYKVTCPDNDIAIDGMWRIDNVDQDNDYVYDGGSTLDPKLDVLLSVEPVAAYPSSVSEFTFKFVPLAGGDVQGKLFVTCLPRSVTTNNGHTHTWLPGSLRSHDATNIAAGTVNVAPNANDCVSTPTTKEIAIQPGFRWDPADTGADQWGKPYRRWPKTTGVTNGWLNWNWSFHTSTGGDVRVYWRCLSKHTDVPQAPATGTHRHKLALQEKLRTSPNPVPIPARQTSEVQVICGEHYKALLAAWDFTGHHADLWHLGMDPRPKSRSFTVLNADANPILTQFTAPATYTGPRFGSLCFKTKTT